MSDAVTVMQAAIIAAVEAHAPLTDEISGIYDGPPPKAAFPYISVGSFMASDWGMKDRIGREIRLALTMWDNGEEPARLHRLIGEVETVLTELPRDVSGWQIASNVFLRSFIARDPAGPWAGMVEQRVRLLAT